MSWALTVTVTCNLYLLFKINANCHAICYNYISVRCVADARLRPTGPTRSL